MAAFYADENFPLQTVEALRRRGHDVLSAIEADQGNRRIPDGDVLEFAKRSRRALLTLNRWDFVGLAARVPEHAGILVCSQDPDVERQAAAIDEAVRKLASLESMLLRINRPT